MANQLPTKSAKKLKNDLQPHQQIQSRAASVVESCNMYSYGLHLRSIKLTVVKVVVSSERTCNNCLFVEVLNYFLNWGSEVFDFLASNS